MAAPILILGGSGGVGSALARNLAKKGIPTHLFARDQGRLEAMATEVSGAEVTAVDVMDGPSLTTAVSEACQGEEGVAGIEVKAGSRVQDRDLAGLRILKSELGDTFVAGAVLHTGLRAYTVEERIHVAPADRLWIPVG